jgi:hypothetical protein
VSRTRLTLYVAAFLALMLLTGVMGCLDLFGLIPKVRGQSPEPPGPEIVLGVRYELTWGASGNYRVVFRRGGVYECHFGSAPFCRGRWERKGDVIVVEEHAPAGTYRWELGPGLRGETAGGNAVTLRRARP